MVDWSKVKLRHHKANYSEKEMRDALARLLAARHRWNDAFIACLRGEVSDDVYRNATHDYKLTLWVEGQRVAHLARLSARRGAELLVLRRRAASASRAVACMYCEATFFVQSGSSFDDVRLQAQQHDASCARNPLVQEIAALRRQMRR